MSSHNECEPQISVWRGGVDPLTRFKLCNGSPRTGAVVLIISRYAGQRQCPKTVEIYGMKRHTSLREGFQCSPGGPPIAAVSLPTINARGKIARTKANNLKMSSFAIKYRRTKALKLMRISLIVGSTLEC